MTDHLEELVAWMAAPEDENLEFKEAKNSFHFEELVKYCCALANEGGGRIVMGVSDKRPRRVVGTAAFEDVQRTKLGLLERLRLRIDVWELHHPDGRVLVFSVPSRPVGVPMQYNGAFWMRGGESIVGMTADQLKRIIDEGQPDFSAEICPAAELSDLDENALAVFRDRWLARSALVNLKYRDHLEVLRAADLYVHAKGFTWAALLLLGRREAVERLLPQAEVIYEFRSHDASPAFDERREFKGGFLSFSCELLDLVRRHNESISLELPGERRMLRSLNEQALLEAIVNAVSHRDYRLQGSTFVRQYPRRLEISSPGGLPVDVTPETIVFCQSPRNRRLAEALVRCGFADRSGQGADRMFSTSLREGKPPPDFSRTTTNSVIVVLIGTVRDPAFVSYLERVTHETDHEFHVEDLLLLNAIYEQRGIPGEVRSRVTELIRVGAIEQLEADRLTLSRRFYDFIGRPGEHTRIVGLGREYKKALLQKHLSSCGKNGSSLRELAQVVPSAPDNELRTILHELMGEGAVRASCGLEDHWTVMDAGSEKISG